MVDDERTVDGIFVMWILSIRGNDVVYLQFIYSMAPVKARYGICKG